MTKIPVFFLLLFACTASMAQQTTALIKAASDKVAIREGDGPLTRFWDHLSPSHPVIYSVSKNRKPGKLTFYTDQDSMVFTVSAGNRYDFKVLLNGKDTCTAQISTVVPTFERDGGYRGSASDTIPFTLGRDNYIHLNGTLNGSTPLDLIFDTGASTFVLTENGKKKVRLSLDGLTENEGTSGFSTEKTSSSNILQVAGLQWKNLALLFYDYKGSLDADGVIGFNIVENKAVEINYDLHILVLHDPGSFSKNGYSFVPMIHGLEGTFIPATLSDGKERAAGWFLFDCGASLTAVAGMDFIRQHKLDGNLHFIGKANVQGTGPEAASSRVALIPLVNIAGFTLNNVPVSLVSTKDGYYGHEGIIGNLILQRFNTIIDYPGATIYFKSNQLAGLPFGASGRTGWMIPATIAGAVLFAIVFLIYRRRSKVSSLQNSL
jgi:hypothetical protein